MVLTAVLGTGLIYLPQDEDDDLEEQYTPVSDSVENAKDLSVALKAHAMKLDETAMLRLEIDAVKNQNQQKEKKYLQILRL
ncbi:hypothetical protein MG293_011485 [Ovis ammon polii]|uniref:Uncharacterized protein n=1 Tax=Ovis ammon polii TaxID=230172 RepID=A0AAD4U1H0_OVIAM|nr:hypothetical protein MG293_011485 [Ovis ammon polii]